MSHLYSCTCDTCKHTPEQLNLGLKNPFKKLLNSVEKAFKKLHKKGTYNPDDLNTIEEYKDLINDTNEILGRAISENELSPKMIEHFDNDVFVFSAIKTNAQLFEASKLLLTADKKIKSFEKFSHDVKTVSNSHQKYLEAEYDFAVGSVQMGERWESFNDNDRYLLQYRTANDDRVRDVHQALHNITLKKSDPFWDMFFPPNGWRCRCTTVEVLAYLSKESDPVKSSKKGHTATTQIGANNKNKLEIFRFNAGKEMKAFPPKHPYNKVKGAATVKKNLKKAK